MHGSSYRLADVEGALCIVETTSDLSEPRFIDTYWPLGRTVRDFLYWENERTAYAGIIANATVRGSAGLEFCIDLAQAVDIPSSALRRFVHLEYGSKTKSLKVEFREYPKPRTRCACEYRDGHWHKYTAAKGWGRT